MEMTINPIEQLIERIKTADTFDEIAETKAMLYQANKAGGINIEDVLSGLYKSPTRFIFELLQNAEDAGATSVSITVEEDRLEFRHNGRPFNLRDIKGITGVNNSEKAEDYTKIGAFGIGFKSVFGVCEAPEIYSDEFNFRIRNCYVPERIDEPYPDQQKGNTYIVLPFIEDRKEEIYKQIETTLLNLPPQTLLFLNSVIQVDYLTITNCGFYRREKEKLNCEGTIYYKCVIKGATGTRNCYYLFEEPSLINEKFKISIAYCFDNETENLTKDSDSNKVVVFFPTEEETFLSFLINGPYQTTRTRESIPETKENIQILSQTIELYKKSIFCFKKLGLITTEFIENLPLISKKKENSYGYRNETALNLFYEEFCEATRKLFLENDLFPTEDGSFTNAQKALLARGPVTDILAKEDNAIIFGDRVNWLSTDITRDRTPNIIAFLLALKVREVDFEVILINLTTDFLKTKTIEWLSDFYKRGNKNIDTVKKHSVREFILTESGDFVAPFVRDGKDLHKNVYLTSKLIKDDTKCVSSKFNGDRDVQLFFANIGIEEMDVVESIRTQWIPTIEDSKSEEEHYDNFYLLYLELEGQDAKTKKEIKELIRDSKCVLYRNNDAQIEFKYPSEMFMAHGAAKILYDGYEKAFFIYDKLDEAAQREPKFFEFLVDLGVNKSLAFVEEYSKLSWEDFYEAVKNYRPNNKSDHAYDILGLDYIIENINFDRTKVVFSTLNSIPEDYFKGTASWKYYSTHKSVTFDAYFVKTLQKAKWICNEEGDFVAPDEIYEEDVRKIYGGGQVLSHFKFKPDLIKQLPPEEQQILELTKGLPLEYLQQMRDQYMQLTAPTPVDVNPEENPVDIEEADFDNSRDELSAEELTYTEEEERSIVDDVFDSLYDNPDIPDEVVEQIVVRRTSNEAKLDGDIGERFVMASLRKRYENSGYKIFNEEENSFSFKIGEDLWSVKRHNSTIKTQKGYDITIVKSGDVVEYIEVKSKKSDEKELFKVSGLQWEFAKKLYQEGNGDKHFVYVVSNVRNSEKTKITKVSNPYKAWLEGRLEADPVRIKY